MRDKKVHVIGAGLRVGEGFGDGFGVGVAYGRGVVYEGVRQYLDAVRNVRARPTEIVGRTPAIDNGIDRSAELGLSLYAASFQVGNSTLKLLEQIGQARMNALSRQCGIDPSKVGG